MSYILDALRKSESERRQGRIPDLGQQVQLIHKPRKKPRPATVWVGLGLILNALVLGVVFWPKQLEWGSFQVQPEPQPVSPAAEIREPLPQSEAAELAPAQPKPHSAGSESPSEPAVTAQESTEAQLSEQEPALGRPTVIVPTAPRPAAPSQAPVEDEYRRVPHLVELPLSFQRSIPDLVFNSHIYASDPSRRRVMINSNYLQVGDQFSGIRVERITEDGVELSKDGRQFRVGVVRDWVSPR